MWLLLTHCLLINSIPGKDRHAAREVSGSILEKLPPAPFELSKEAARVYREEGAELIAQSLLKASDITMLAMYATEVGLYIEEMSAAREEGVVIELPNGISTSSAHRKAAEGALKNASALADKLGLNPNSRHRIQGGDGFKQKAISKNDPMYNILFPKKKDFQIKFRPPVDDN